MSRRRVLRTNNDTAYIIAVVIIIIAFLLLGGWQWLKGLMHGNDLLNFGNYNWPLILICVGIGIVLGVLFFRRR
ncbi:MAG: hypothetical protein P1P88_05110 [Bacteroidales bacterium]|nr:hypothetical protein [Bacteroidales bacterium]